MAADLTTPALTSGGHTFGSHFPNAATFRIRGRRHNTVAVCGPALPQNIANARLSGAGLAARSEAKAGPAGPAAAFHGEIR